jgi:hypothetical protein
VVLPALEHDGNMNLKLSRAIINMSVFVAMHMELVAQNKKENSGNNDHTNAKLIKFVGIVC